MSRSVNQRDCAAAQKHLSTGYATHAFFGIEA